ncbi:DUF3618 domain-containing protein [Nocardioides sp. URHA0020]|uniref:DUF3618 domain-containing protein n=1 Tax=Nocardioides sp. URHA0020 TaxID=1380392 RepID=UPI0006879F42|nr:DUF3618 domain-containing protein [Nocardioides sp. URHA0020]
MATNDTAHSARTHQDDGSAPAEEAKPELAEVQADIERTRADLADTVDQLTAKLDVKTRVRNSLADTKDDATAQLRRLQDRATDDEGKPTPTTLGIGGGTLAAVLAVIVLALWRRNNATRRPRRRR